MMTITPITRDIAIVEAKKYPNLTANGFNYFRFADPKNYSNTHRRLDRQYLWSEIGCLEIAYTIQFVRENRIDLRISSYGIKHAVERWSDEQYPYCLITNGCAILGLSLAGYQIEIPKDSPNCFFYKRRQV